jgi:hypothetical protein
MNMDPLLTFLAEDPFFTINIRIFSGIQVDLIAVITILVVAEGSRAVWAKPSKLPRTKLFELSS